MKNTPQPFYFTGPLSLQKAMLEELVKLGYRNLSEDSLSEYKYSLCSNQSCPRDKNTYSELFVVGYNITEGHKHFNLPQDWNAALEYCTEALEKFEDDYKTITIAGRNKAIEVIVYKSGKCEAEDKEFGVRDIVEIIDFKSQLPWEANIQVINIGCCHNIEISELKKIVSAYTSL